METKGRSLGVRGERETRESCLLYTLAPFLYSLLFPSRAAGHIIRLCRDVLGVDRERSMVVNQAAVGTIGYDASFLAELCVLVTIELGESPLLGDHNLLSSRELEGSTAGSLKDVLGDVVLAADGEDDLSNLDTGHETIGLTKSTTHSSLESISSST